MSADRQSRFGPRDDGGGRAADKCALVAEERDDRQFSGFLTYAPDLVDETAGQSGVRAGD